MRAYLLVVVRRMHPVRAVPPGGVDYARILVIDHNGLHCGLALTDAGVGQCVVRAKRQRKREGKELGEGERRTDMTTSWGGEVL